jgi:TPR repeat protein
VAMDIEKALELYSQSGKQGHASALMRLGYLYQFGMAEPGNYILLLLLLFIYLFIYNMLF